MPYREVGVLVTKEVLLLWLGRVPKKQIARQLGLDPKTVRRYVRAAKEHGLGVSQGLEALTEDKFASILIALHRLPERPRGEASRLCHKHRRIGEAIPPY